MRRRAFLIATIVAWFTFLVPSAMGMSCMGSSFEEQVAQAQAIFVGTVTSVEAVSLPNTIVTYYRFDTVRYLKGQGPPDSLLLVQHGGSDGRIRIHVSGEVSFRSGARYVVFATKGYGPVPNQYHAMACGTGHPFGYGRTRAPRIRLFTWVRATPLSRLMGGTWSPYGIARGPQRVASGQGTSTEGQNHRPHHHGYPCPI